jgi:hypothetical protein
MKKHFSYNYFSLHQDETKVHFFKYLIQMRVEY